MPIRVKCEPCDKTLRVDDRYAGKKVKCPVCGKPLLIPAPTAAPAAPAAPPAPPKPPPAGPSLAPPAKSAPIPVGKPAGAPPAKPVGVKAAPPATRPPASTNGKAPTNGTAPPLNTQEVDAIAAEAWGDELKAKQEQAAPTAIKLTCMYCDEEVEFPLEQGGKQAQCPQCKRIIKVPKPAIQKKQDWRDTTRDGPQFAKDNQLPVLEGVWDTKNVDTVRKKVLEEADAIPFEEEEDDRSRLVVWGQRVLIALVVLGALAGVYASLTYQQATQRELKAFKDTVAALEAAEKKYRADPKAKDLPSLEQLAELHRSVGEFYTRAEKPLKALEHFRAARGKFMKADATWDVKSPERELFLIDLAISVIELGGTEEQEIAKTHIIWDKVQDELSRSLTVLANHDSRLQALRELGQRLLERQQGPMAVSLGLPFATEDSKPGQRSPLYAAPVAFLLARGDEAKAWAYVPAPTDSDPELAARLGYAEGHTYRGNLDAARKLIKLRGLPLDRLRTQLAVAADLLAKKQPGDAAALLSEARELRDKELKSVKLPPLLTYQLARLAIQLEPADKAAAAIDAIIDGGCKARAQLDLLLKESVASSTPISAQRIGDTKSLAYAQALLHEARQKTQRGARTELTQSLEALDETQRLFVTLGIALGEQDKR